ncbi:hypothetical protein VOM14_06080 [Paraburkholderia sp. MPAMCS5]|uniref:hypothetical protein n=1 Tax=Paraburkholderia sp. MPAMCS5 TaxID=3112563 RepID=UPI002E1738F3|nr:hypothetical protein [Paraburkholderia sp. MPAMCS5]
MHNDARHFAQAASYAAKIVQANMHPRHIVGEWITFETTEQAVVGDDIFVAFDDGTTITWHLDAISDAELTVIRRCRNSCRFNNGYCFDDGC